MSALVVTACGRVTQLALGAVIGRGGVPPVLPFDLHEDPNVVAPELEMFTCSSVPSEKLRPDHSIPTRTQFTELARGGRASGPLIGDFPQRDAVGSRNRKTHEVRRRPRASTAPDNWAPVGRA
jgi:hypothetical protein